MSTLIQPDADPSEKRGSPLQQPDWKDPVIAWQVAETLAQMPSLVRHQDVEALQGLLGCAAEGKLSVLQFGDCAEDPLIDAGSYVDDAVQLGSELTAAAGADPSQLVLVGRIGGQYAKPRSQPLERVGDQDLPAYRGHLVNRPEAEGRNHDAWHMMTCFGAAQQVMARLGWLGQHGSLASESRPLWTSHEALVLDYEWPLIRPSRAGVYLSSTHWPWVGERTRDPWGHHVRFLSRIGNPVAVKIGPSATPEDALALCAVLNPDRIPGRLTFISRMGVGKVGATLGPIVDAVQEMDQPVVWMCDPMHGNTRKTGEDVKIRYVDEIIAEVGEFVDTLARRGAHAGGLHLEATMDDVMECQSSPYDTTRGRQTTLCDPRLNADQARQVVAGWASLTRIRGLDESVGVLA